MPRNLATEDDTWKAARDAVAAGVSLQATADKLGLDYEILKKRAQRAGWSRPHLAIRKAKEARTTIEALSRIVPEGVKTPESVPESSSRALTAEEKTGTIIMESALELAESGSMMGAKLWHGLLVDASKPGATLAPLVEAKDVMTAVKGLRMVGGLDRSDVSVHLNLWGASPKGPSRDMGTSCRDIGDNFDGAEE